MANDQLDRENQQEDQRRNDPIGSSSRFDYDPKELGPIIDRSRLPQPEPISEEQVDENLEPLQQPSRFRQGIDEGRQRVTDAAKDYAVDKAKDAAKRAAGKAVKKVGEQVAKKVATQAISKAATAALAATSEFWVPALIVVVVIIALIIGLIVLFSFSGGGDVEASGTSITQSFDQTSTTDVSALRALVTGGVNTVEKANAVLVETARLRTLLSDNSRALAILETIDTAAKAIVSNPTDAVRIRTEAKKISDLFSELSALLVSGLPKEGSYWRALYDEAVTLGAVKNAAGDTVGTPVSQLHGEFNLRSSTCSGGLSRIMARVQEKTGKYSAQENIDPLNACIDLFRALTNPTSRWAARLIAGQAFTTTDKTEIKGERFGDLLAANKVPRGALVYITSTFNSRTGKNQQGHVFMFTGTENRTIFRSGSGGANWVNDTRSFGAYQELDVIVVALDTGIWAR